MFMAFTAKRPATVTVRNGARDGATINEVK
jgi:hypothetical protein